MAVPTLSQAQMHRIERSFRLSHGAPRFVDRRSESGIVYVIKNVPMWRDATSATSNYRPLAVYQRLSGPFGLNIGMFPGTSAHRIRIRVYAPGSRRKALLR